MAPPGPNRKTFGNNPLYKALNLKRKQLQILPVI